MAALPLCGIGAIGLALSLAISPAAATPALTMDVATGDVLYQQEATRSWYPASTTKLMTVYVALQAVRDGRIGMNTPIVYSARARAMPPSKMGFLPGTQVTLVNALRMLMVKSANDIAVTVAEGVSGSVEAFADDMNRAAAEIGLRESHFVNPNGLPNPDHYSSARDMALIARALYTTFPDQQELFDIGALSFGSEIIPNHNNLLGRYPGADGMKTGFTCPAGFNVVASAFRDGRRIVTVVMGAPSVATRTAKAAALFDRAFANVDRPTGTVMALPHVGGDPPDMRNAICHARSTLVAQFNSDVAQLDAGLAPQQGSSSFHLFALEPERGFLFGSAPQAIMPAEPTALRINSLPQPYFTPVPIHVGADPGYQGPVAQARAPHTPIGSDTLPSTAQAYAGAPESGQVEGLGVSPLADDPSALPMRHAARTRAHRGRAGALKAAAEAPKTKLIAAEGDGDAKKSPRKAKRSSKPSGKPGTAKATAKPAGSAS